MYAYIYGLHYLPHAPAHTRHQHTTRFYTACHGFGCLLPNACALHTTHLHCLFLVLRAAACRACCHWTAVGSGSVPYAPHTPAFCYPVPSLPPVLYACLVSPHLFCTVLRVHAWFADSHYLYRRFTHTPPYIHYCTPAVPHTSSPATAPLHYCLFAHAPAWVLRYTGLPFAAQDYHLSPHTSRLPLPGLYLPFAAHTFAVYLWITTPPHACGLYLRFSLAVLPHSSAFALPVLVLATITPRYRSAYGSTTTPLPGLPRCAAFHYYTNTPGARFTAYCGSLPWFLHSYCMQFSFSRGSPHLVRYHYLDFTLYWFPWVLPLYTLSGAFFYFILVGSRMVRLRTHRAPHTRCAAAVFTVAACCTFTGCPGFDTRFSYAVTCRTVATYGSTAPHDTAYACRSRIKFTGGLRTAVGPLRCRFTVRVVVRLHHIHCLPFTLPPRTAIPAPPDTMA